LADGEDGLKLKEKLAGGSAPMRYLGSCIKTLWVTISPLKSIIALLKLLLTRAGKSLREIEREIGRVVERQSLE
jgi:hypothetical protein